MLRYTQNIQVWQAASSEVLRRLTLGAGGLGGQKEPSVKARDRVSSRGNSKYRCWEEEASLGRVKEGRPEWWVNVAKER